MAQSRHPATCGCRREPGAPRGMSLLTRRSAPLGTVLLPCAHPGQVAPGGSGDQQSGDQQNLDETPRSSNPDPNHKTALAAHALLHTRVHAYPHTLACTHARARTHEAAFPRALHQHQSPVCGCELSPRPSRSTNARSPEGPAGRQPAGVTEGGLSAIRVPRDLINLSLETVSLAKSLPD